METKDTTKTIIASTASPFKFGSKVAAAIGMDIEGKDQFSILEDMGTNANIAVPQAIKTLKHKKILHDNNCT